MNINEIRQIIAKKMAQEGSEDGILPTLTPVEQAIDHIKGLMEKHNLSPYLSEQEFHTKDEKGESTFNPEWWEDQVRGVYNDDSGPWERNTLKFLDYASVIPKVFGAVHEAGATSVAKMLSPRGAPSGGAGSVANSVR